MRVCSITQSKLSVNSILFPDVAILYTDSIEVNYLLYTYLSRLHFFKHYTLSPFLHEQAKQVRVQSYAGPPLL